MDRYVSKSIQFFIKTHCPDLFSIIELDPDKLGAEFNQERGILSVGIGRKKDWLVHELGHIVFASNEELLQKDYGCPIASKYNFKDIKNEMNVFRFQHVVFSHLSMKHCISGSCKLIQRQTVESLIDKDRAKMKDLMLTMKRAFYDPIQDGELEMYMQELNQKLIYLKFLKKSQVEDLINDDLLDDHFQWKAS